MSVILTDELDVEQSVIQTSTTYSKDFERIYNTKIDGLDALKEAIHKRLTTEKYECELYSFDYGLETSDLIGKDEEYVKSELKRRINESLMIDDRITSVGDFEFNVQGENMYISVLVESEFGAFSVEERMAVM